jgi:hypothetical protein
MPTYDCNSCGRFETITAFIPEACSCCGGGLALTAAEQRAVTERIAAQNDRFRTTLGTAPDVPGQLVATSGVRAKGAAFLAAAGAAVQAFATFTEDNDPHGEHDFGAITVEGVAVWWKIDLYDPAYACGSERRDDLTATRRVLTLLLPEDY